MTPERAVGQGAVTAALAFQSLRGRSPILVAMAADDRLRVALERGHRSKVEREPRRSLVVLVREFLSLLVAAFVRWCRVPGPNASEPDSIEARGFDAMFEMVHQGEVERAWRAVLSAIEVLGEDEDEALCCVGASFLEDLVQDHHHELWPR